VFFVTACNQKKKLLLSVCLLMGLISPFVTDFSRTQELSLHLELQQCFVLYFTEYVSLGNGLFDTM